MAENEKYDLTEEEFQDSLKMAEIAVFMHSKPSDKPTSVFIVSQPGAGKTGLRTHVESKYSTQFIDFDPDEIAIYHKYYKEILQEYPKESHRLLQKFVLPALDNYLRYKAVLFKNNIMQEGTFASTDGYLRILDFQKNGGKLPFPKVNENGEKEEQYAEGHYNIDINVLAVDRFESLLSSYEREEDFIQAGLPPRSVTPENHDRAYKNIIETLRKTQERGLYDNISIFRRGEIETQPRKVWEIGNPTYQGPIQALLGEREKDRKRLLSNPQAYLDRIERLKARITRDDANSRIQMEKINKLEQEFLQLLRSIGEQSL